MSRNCLRRYAPFVYPIGGPPVGPRWMPNKSAPGRERPAAGFGGAGEHRRRGRAFLWGQSAAAPEGPGSPGVLKAGRGAGQSRLGNGPTSGLDGIGPAGIGAFPCAGQFGCRRWMRDRGTAYARFPASGDDGSCARSVGRAGSASSPSKGGLRKHPLAEARGFAAPDPAKRLIVVVDPKSAHSTLIGVRQAKPGRGERYV